VVFRSGWSDKYLRPFPTGNSRMADPINGKTEGWPAPGADAMLYRARKGVRCVATDGPTFGGAEPKRALFTYWALGGSSMAGVEYLTNLDQLPEGAYFLFAAPKSPRLPRRPWQGASSLLMPFPGVWENEVAEESKRLTKRPRRFPCVQWLVFGARNPIWRAPKAI
jgi:hypothetical protein